MLGLSKNQADHDTIRCVPLVGWLIHGPNEKDDRTLVTSSVLVTSSKALVPSSDAFVSNSFLLLLARHLFLVAMHLFLIASCYY